MADVEKNKNKILGYRAERTSKKEKIEEKKLTIPLLRRNKALKKFIKNKSILFHITHKKNTLQSY